MVAKNDEKKPASWKGREKRRGVRGSRGVPLGAEKERWSGRRGEEKRT